MSSKTYELDEAQRAVIHTLLAAELAKQRKHAPWLSNLTDTFANEHPVDPEIVGRKPILDYMHERGFKGREFDAMMSFTWGPKNCTWEDIITGLNMGDPVSAMLRVPNIGTLTVRSVLMRCIAHGWIRNADARRLVDRYLTETAPKRKD